MAAKRPLAVLFDEGTDLAGSMIHIQNGLSFDLKKVDLWEAFRKKPVRVQGMSLMSSGGPGWFDQIVLGRTAEDLPAKQ